MKALRVTFLAGAVSLLSAASPSPRFDLIVRGGTVVDGSGVPGFPADIGVIGDHIAAIGQLGESIATEEIDATGQIVAPGFINIHDHAIAEALPTAANMLSQGVTTEIMNADGLGPADIATQLAAIERAGSAVNVGAQIGFNAIWKSVMGDTQRRATRAEITEMRRRLTKALEAGAWGVSSGLDFAPLSGAHRDDIIAVLSAARAWRTNFPNHERLSPTNGFSSLAGVAETIDIAESAGVMPVITHIKLQGKEQGRTADLLVLIGAARHRGTAIAADIYPYTAGQTGLQDLLVPAWAQAGGRASMLDRFRDKAMREQIGQSAEATMAARFDGPRGVFVLAERAELTDLMRRKNSSAGEAVIAALERNPTAAILRFGRDGDLTELLRQPFVAIACDCGATLETNIHPRTYGTFPRILGKFSREEGILSLESAVTRMTSLPAAISGLADRGLLRVGMKADITMFNAATVADRATYEDPARLSTGITTVIVNGRTAWRNLAPTGIRAGHILRRSALEPSRLPLREQRRVTARIPIRFSNHGAMLQVEIGGASAPDRGGKIVITGAAGRTVFRSKRIGAVQRWHGWIGVAGWAMNDKGRDGPFLLLVRRNGQKCARAATGTLRFGEKLESVSFPTGTAWPFDGGQSAAPVDCTPLAGSNELRHDVR